MNGHDFTRIDVDFTAKIKARKYSFNEVAVRLERAVNGLANLRVTEDYEDAKYWFVDTTMSCDLEEAIGWMKFYMENAIAYGIQTKNLDWRTKFLAAYDLFNELAS